MANSVWLSSDGGVFAGQQVGPVASNVVAPPFSFLGDLTSGYGSSAVGTLDLVTAGVSRLSINSASASFLSGAMTLTSAGALNALTSLALGTSRGTLSTNADAQWKFLNNAGNAGAGIDFATNSTIKFYNTTFNGYAVVYFDQFYSTDKLKLYNNVTTAGWGVPAIYASGEALAQTALVASVATYTVGAADGMFEIHCNVNVTTSTTHNFGVVVTYTDETNAARSLTMPVVQLTGSVIAAITNVTGAGPYEGVVCVIKCKASTAITITTAGTFTNVVYNVKGTIAQIA